MSKVAVIGAGYVGLTTAACLADLGNDVTVVDIDREKIAQLQKGHVPFYEPGLTELVQRNAEGRRLRFTTSYRDAVPGAEYAIIAVSTPEGEGGEADLSYVEAAAGSIADCMDGPLVVVNKSTVPPLTGDMVSRVLRQRNSKHEAHVLSNPEFLREGSAIQDFMHPDRVVVGSHDRAAAEKVAQLYEPLQAPILITPNIYTAEMVKYASNAFLAARISFINEIARISERVGADAKLVAEGMGLDKRIGPAYLDVGIGYGGSCFGKDVKALAALAQRFDYHPELLHAVMDINRDQRMLVIDKLRDALDGLNERTVGFIGSHLCEALLARGLRVLALDNFITGSSDNLHALSGNPDFEFRQANVNERIDVEGDVRYVLHFASPASPPQYNANPIHTLKVGTLGTTNMLGLARAKAATFLLASTSEVYGDPLVHPQPESYWGNVNPIGPRGVYDEAKRFAEALTMAYHRFHGLDTRIVRIFNTYGRRMRPNDGRVVSNFIVQACGGEPLTVYGDGSQTRSFCYVDDLIDGIVRLFERGDADPTNIGNPHEFTVRQLAELVLRRTGSRSPIVERPLPIDDPKVRQPDIARARATLGWEPRISLDEGLQRTIEYFRTLVCK